MPKDQRDSVERNKVRNVFGDDCRPYAIPTPTWPVVTGTEGRNSTMPVNDLDNSGQRQRPAETS